MFDPIAAPGGAQQAPYETYARLRREAPVYHNELRGFWALSRFEDVRAASRDWQVFSNAAGVDLDGLGTLVFGPGDFLDTDPPEHDELRAVVRSRFTPKSIAAAEPMVRGLATQLLDEMRAASDPDAAEHVAWPLPCRAMCALLGFSPADRSHLTELYRVVMQRPPGAISIPPEALAAAADMRAYFVSQAEERRRRPRDDVMTDIARAQLNGEPLPDSKVAGLCFVLFSAGIDTVASLIGSAVLLFAQHPDQRRLVARDPGALPAALEEVLRFESPLQFNARTTTEPVTFAATEIPAGERVLLLYGSANRDETRYEDPARFDVARPPKRHLAFGEGIHFCIGAPLARLQARVALEEILARMPDYEVRGAVEHLPAYNMRTPARLPVVM